MTARRLARDPRALVAAALLAAVVAGCLVWPELSPYPATDVDFGRSERTSSDAIS